jgi:hypothetical protein
MLTQKTVQASANDASGARRAAILVEGFVPSEGIQDRFDIGASYRGVAMYLRDRGFAVEGCADYNGAGFHGGDLSGTPWNACQFDVYTDPQDALQARLSRALRMIADAREFRATLRMAVKGVEGAVVEKGETDPEACIGYLRVIEAASDVEVRYACGARNGGFRL